MGQKSKDERGRKSRTNVEKNGRKSPQRLTDEREYDEESNGNEEEKKEISGRKHQEIKKDQKRNQYTKSGINDEKQTEVCDGKQMRNHDGDQLRNKE